MSTAVATQQISQSLGSPRQQDRKALVSSDGKNGKILCIIHRILTWTFMLHLRFAILMIMLMMHVY